MAHMWCNYLSYILSNMSPLSKTQTKNLTIIYDSLHIPASFYNSLNSLFIPLLSFLCIFIVSTLYS